MSDEVKTEVKEVEAPENAFEIEKGGRSAKVEEPKVEEPKEEKIDSDPKEAGTENQPKKSRAQKRIEKLAKDKRELVKELADLKAEKEPKEPKSELDPDDFEDYDAYLDTVTNEDTDAKKPKETKEPKPSKEENDFQEVLDSIEVKFDETRDKYEDFDELVQKQPSDGGPHITMSMVEAINEVDNSGEVAYSLAKDIKESIRISKLSPIKQIIAIDKLSGKLGKQAEQPSKVKKTTNAPEPINAIGGGEVVQKTLAGAESFSDYAAIRESKNLSRNGW